jgi:transcription initiation factor IIF auxiliary subunit
MCVCQTFPGRSSKGLIMSSGSSSQSTFSFSSRHYLLGAGAFCFATLTLLIGKLAGGWSVDSVTIVLFLILWIPLALPLIKRAKYKDLELEFVDRVKQAVRENVAQVQENLAALADQTAIVQEHLRQQDQLKQQGQLKQQDQPKPEEQLKQPDITVDPYSIRLDYDYEPIIAEEKRRFRVTVRLTAPEEYLSMVEKVIWELHPTFKKRFQQVSSPPFEITFRCWGEFTIKAAIKLKNGDTYRRQKYIALHDRNEWSARETD